MKVKTIATAMPVITKVYDSINEFSRKLALVPAFKELKTILEMLEEERQNLLAKVEKDDKGQVLPAYHSYLEIEFNKLLNAEVAPEKFLKFTLNEVEKSGIKGSEIALIIDEFIQQ